jgi:predicted HD phosphohydrolase
MGYDIHCEDLARMFLSDFAEPYTKEELTELSEAIQTAIENWLGEHRKEK